MAVFEAAAITTTLKNASELLATLRNSYNVDELRSGVSNLAEMLFEARTNAIAVQEKMQLIKDELATLKEEAKQRVDFADKAQEYEMVTHMAGFVYKHNKPASEQTKSARYCATCFGNQKISVMQPKATGGAHLRCPVCGTTTG